MCFFLIFVSGFLNQIVEIHVSNRLFFPPGSDSSWFGRDLSNPCHLAVLSLYVHHSKIFFLPNKIRCPLRFWYWSAKQYPCCGLKWGSLDPLSIEPCPVSSREVTIFRGSNKLWTDMVVFCFLIQKNKTRVYFSSKTTIMCFFGNKMMKQKRRFKTQTNKWGLWKVKQIAKINEITLNFNFH